MKRNKAFEQNNPSCPTKRDSIAASDPLRYIDRLFCLLDQSCHQTSAIHRNSSRCVVDWSVSFFCAICMITIFAGILKQVILSHHKEKKAGMCFWQPIYTSYTIKKASGVSSAKPEGQGKESHLWWRKTKAGGYKTGECSTETRS